jgi:hypothetical protein
MTDVNFSLDAPNHRRDNDHEHCRGRVVVEGPTYRRGDAGLGEQNKAHEIWRGLAEAQKQDLAKKWATATAMNKTLKAQLAANAPKETLTDTATAMAHTLESGAVDFKEWERILRSGSSGLDSAAYSARRESYEAAGLNSTQQ